jgi:hypothetical protein
MPRARTTKTAPKTKAVTEEKGLANVLDLAAEWASLETATALIEKVKKADTEGTYRNLRIEVTAVGYRLNHGYNAEGKYEKGFEGITKKLTDILTKLEKEAATRVKNINGTGGHPALLTEKGIKVGCNTVTYAKFKELAEKVEAYLADAPARQAEKERLAKEKAAALAAKPKKKAAPRRKKAAETRTYNYDRYGYGSNNW